MTDNELRWQLRQLPREVEPGSDLWPGIAARLHPARTSASRPWPWLAGLAMAASLALALVFAPRPMPAVPTESNFRAALVEREADAMTREYRAALSQLDGAPVPEPLQPSLQTLDQSAVDIRAAIAADPGSAFLLQQLQRTYARRLSLTQRAVTG